MPITVEDVWQLFSTVLTFVSAPLWLTSMLDTNPFAKGGWAYVYTHQGKDKENGRASPFYMPLIVSTIIWILVSIASSLAFYIIYHNNGLNNGWDVTPVPLFFGLGALVASVAWTAIYLRGCACDNLLWVPVVAICLSIAYTFFSFKVIDSGKIFYPILTIALIVWDLFWLIKLFFEDNERCGRKLSIIKQCYDVIASRIKV